jgi:hypothetical protein
MASVLKIDAAIENDASGDGQSLGEMAWYVATGAVIGWTESL